MIIKLNMEQIDIYIPICFSVYHRFSGTIANMVSILWPIKCHKLPTAEIMSLYRR